MMNINNWHPIGMSYNHLIESVDGEVKQVSSEQLVARYNWLLTEYRNRPAHDETITDDTERDGVGDA